MTKRKNIPEAIEVRIRFITAFEELKNRGRVKNKIQFCAGVGLGKKATTNFIQMRNGLREPRILNILLLNKKYGVSIKWIMLGEGDFLDIGQKQFKTNSSKSMLF